MFRTRTWMLLPLVAAAALAPGCRTAGPGAQSGALLGGLLGAGAGYAVGRHNGHQGYGTAAGAAVGALGGYALGAEADAYDRERYAAYAPPRVEYAYPTEVRRYEYYEPPPERVVVRERVYYPAPRTYVVREYRPSCW